MSQTMWIIATVIAVAGLILFGLIMNRLFKKQRAVDKTFEPLVLRFRYTKNDVNPCEVEKRFTWLFVALLFYAGLALAVVTHNATDLRWLRHTMYTMAALGCLAGVLESLLIIRKSAKAAPVLSLAKWALLAVWTVGMFAGLFIRGWAL